MRSLPAQGVAKTPQCDTDEDEIFQEALSRHPGQDRKPESVRGDNTWSGEQKAQSTQKQHDGHRTAYGAGRKR